jgi:hypothetical protein
VEQEDLEQEVQPPPPCDGVNLPPLLAPKTENFFVTLRLLQAGHATGAVAVPTSFSKPLPQRPQTNSKIGTTAAR